MDFYKANTRERFNFLTDKDYGKIERIIKLRKYPYFIPLSFGVWADNSLCSVAFFVKTPNRIFYLFGISNEKVYNIMRDDAIDILIDLSGHTPRNNLELFLMKPAPIQISYCGYPNTTGISTMDYRIVDNFTDPEGYDKFATEKLLRMPRSFLCFNSLDKENLYPNEQTAYEKNGYIYQRACPSDFC